MTLNSTNNPVKSLALLILAYLLGAQAIAADNSAEKERWFQIEVIVFQRTDLKDLHAEEWPETVKAVDIDSAIDFLSPIPAFKGAKNPTETIPELMSPITEIIADNAKRQFIPLEKSELPFLPLQESFHQMIPQLTSIKRSSKYHLLKHIAWRQPTLSPKQAIAVRILGGRDFAENYNAGGSKKDPVNLQQGIEGNTFTTINDKFEAFAVAESLTSNTETFSLPEDNDFLFDFETPTDSDLTRQEPPPITGLDEFEPARPHVWELDGTIEITLRRYLHVNLQLELKKPQEKIIAVEEYGKFIPTEDTFSTQLKPENFIIQWESEEATGFQLPLSDSADSVKVEYLQPYFLSQKRRIRSKEVHYFDHPFIGVLVLITPYDHKPEAEPENDMETQTGQ